MRTSTLIEDMPEFEVRDERLYITGNIAKYSLPLNIVLQCLPAIATAIDAYERRPSNVVPLYAGCNGCPGHPHAA